MRRSGEFESGHVPRAISAPLHELAARVGSLERSRPVAAICAGGYRSSIATSVLERMGFPRVTNVVGGMGAWTAAGYETTRPRISHG